MSSKKRLLQLFGLPKDEIIFEDFSCACQDGILKHGRMFIAENYICFYATVLGFKTKRVINVNEIQDIKKEAVLGFINNAIEIKTKDQKSHFFCSFWNRESAYKLLYGIWKGEPLQDIDKENSSDKDDNISEQGSQSAGDSLVVEQSDVEILNPETSEENKELLRCILPVSVDAFFEKFIGDNAIFSYGQHMEKNGSTDIKISEWAENEELKCFTRECNLVIKVSGVPLRDTSRFQKIQTYKKEGENLIISSTSKVFDVPYSGYFTTEEKWEISPVEGSSDKCLLVCKGWVTFNKNTMMKKTITQRNEQGLKEDYEVWIGRIRKILQPKKPEENPNNSNKQQFEQVLTKNELNLNKNNPKDNQSKKVSKLQSSGKIVGTEDFKRLNQGITILIGLIGMIILLIALDIIIFNNNVNKLDLKIANLEKMVLSLTQQLINQNLTSSSTITTDYAIGQQNNINQEL
ncbi:GRAM domain protein (macronuclear) [Tetrahymena thermophila SB210]|uniref:GRAM domain protein n=1 Tax=Tetrahymena thermophila (strain SB210) TaxID=312017 RepID=Q22XZ6_TETTS|nr:GRAM domain protein [Tetrahymena thermophila SB210]EAR90228.1 GRAM domain protein [Tetrahymena thermophila SB210]|eukprot:XP_001010473.1 GRAM domain protein [Tetrahymena thermophila SB210]